MSADTNPPAGIPDPGAMQTTIRDAAKRAQELQRQVEAARASLSEAAAEVQELERQAAAAQKTITRYQEQETDFTRAMQDARRASDEIIQAAKARAEDAQRASDEIIQAAKARAEETVTSAKATAETIIRSARNAAADTVHKARESVQEQLQAAERTAVERLAQLGSGSDQSGGEANPIVEKTKKATEQYLMGIIAKLDAFIHDRERASRSLEALAKNHADSLQTMSRLKAEVQKEILPAMQRLLRGLKGEDAGEARGWAQDEAENEPENQTENEVELEVEAEAEQRAPLGLVPEPPKPEWPAAPARPAREAQRERPVAVNAGAGKYSGDVVVSPIHSFMQATKFITALTQVKGVANVKLRNYAGAKLTIDVLTEGQPVGAIDCALIDGFPIEVVESADDHLVLRIGSPAARPTTR